MMELPGSGLKHFLKKIAQQLVLLPQKFPGPYLFTQKSVST